MSLTNVFDTAAFSAKCTILNIDFIEAFKWIATVESVANAAVTDPNAAGFVRVLQPKEKKCTPSLKKLRTTKFHAQEDLVLRESGSQQVAQLLRCAMCLRRFAGSGHQFSFALTALLILQNLFLQLIKAGSYLKRTVYENMKKECSEQETNNRLLIFAFLPSRSV